MVVSKESAEMSPSRWWIGKTLKCSVCPTTVTLEATNFPAAYVTDAKRVVSATCPNCGHHLELSEPLP